MALIKTIPEVQRYVRVNFANANSSLPNMDEAEEKYIVPLIGRELYDDVVTKYDAGDTSDVFKALLNRIQAALAPLAYYLELPFINTQITDIGLMKSGTAQMQPVFKHDFYKTLSTLHDRGMGALERLLNFLTEKKSDYPLWTASDAYNQFQSLLVKTGQEFSEIYTLLHPRRCFLLLQPTMSMVQEKYLGATVGTDFLNELLAVAAPSEAEKYLILLLKKALVYLTVHQATGLLAVRLTDEGFTVQTADADLADPNRTAADAQGLRWLAEAAERNGNSYLVDARRYLNQTASATVFATYFQSSLYQDPNTPKPPLNSQLKSSFTL